jgi:hypothetical protein
VVFSYKSHSCWSGQPPREVTGQLLDPQMGRQILQDHSPTGVEGSCSVEHSSTVSTGSLFCRTLCGVRFYTRLQGLDSSHDISAFSAGQCNIPATPAVFVSNSRPPSKSSCVDNVAAQLPKRRCYSTQALTALSRLSAWHSNQLSALSTSDGLRYTRR